MAKTSLVAQVDELERTQRDRIADRKQRVLKHGESMVNLRDKHYGDALETMNMLLRHETLASDFFKKLAEIERG